MLLLVFFPHEKRTWVRGGDERRDGRSEGDRPSVSTQKRNVVVVVVVRKYSRVIDRRRAEMIYRVCLLFYAHTGSVQSSGTIR